MMCIKKISRFCVFLIIIVAVYTLSSEVTRNKKLEGLPRLFIEFEYVIGPTYFIYDEREESTYTDNEKSYTYMAKEYHQEGSGNSIALSINQYDSYEDAVLSLEKSIKNNFVVYPKLILNTDIGDLAYANSGTLCFVRGNITVDVYCGEYDLDDAMIYAAELDKLILRFMNK